MVFDVRLRIGVDWLLTIADRCCRRLLRLQWVWLCWNLLRDLLLVWLLLLRVQLVILILLIVACLILIGCERSSAQLVGVSIRTLLEVLRWVAAVEEWNGVEVVGC